MISSLGDGNVRVTETLAKADGGCWVSIHKIPLFCVEDGVKWRESHNKTHCRASDGETVTITDALLLLVDVGKAPKWNKLGGNFYKAHLHGAISDVAEEVE